MIKGGPLPNTYGRNLVVFEVDILNRYSAPVPPTLAEVVWSLNSDASTVRHGQPFEEWCGFGADDPDSIKALAMFNACRDIWAGLVRLGADFDELDVLFQDY